MVRCFPYALDFGKGKNVFYGISAFLKIIFAQLPGGKPTDPGEFLFFIYIYPLKSLNFVLTLGANLDGHRDTWTGCKHGSGNTIYKFISEMIEEVQYCGNL